jgi:hypothetical protein
VLPLEPKLDKNHREVLLWQSDTRLDKPTNSRELSPWGKQPVKPIREIRRSRWDRVRGLQIRELIASQLAHRPRKQISKKVPSRSDLWREEQPKELVPLQSGAVQRKPIKEVLP